MDNVERMYRHLVRTIRTSFPQYLSQPFEVGELYQNILPYRLHRRDLGLETNQDYEHTLLELLRGANGYVVADDRLRDALSTDADPQRIREFATSLVSLSPQALQQHEATLARARVPPAHQRPMTRTRWCRRLSRPGAWHCRSQSGKREKTAPTARERSPVAGRLPFVPTAART